MRRKDREMPAEFALGVVDRCEWAVLSMTEEGGAPYCVPVTIARAGMYVYFHCAQEGHKLDCLRRDGRVCLACVGDTRRPPDDFTTEYESAIVRGEARELTEDGEKIEALRLICQRHTPTNMAAFDTSIQKSLRHTSVWRIGIDGISGKRKK